MDRAHLLATIPSTIRVDWKTAMAYADGWFIAAESR